MYIMLQGKGSPAPAQIYVEPGGGAGSVGWNDGSFRVSPQVGDQLAISIYYDQRGHDYFTATDLTQHTTQTVRTDGPKMIYLTARLFAVAYSTATPPAADTRLSNFADSHLTTYAGVHGTVLGPWTTSKMIVTSNGTSPGPVVASPSGLRNGGRDFDVWLRALPKACATAGLVVWAYADYGGGYAGATPTPSASPTCPAMRAPCAATPGCPRSAWPASSSAARQAGVAGRRPR